MKYKRIIFYTALLITIIVSASNYSHAQLMVIKDDADSLVKRGSDYIYNAQFSLAEECFRKIQERYPNHPTGYFLDAMIDWWKITLFKTTDRYDAPFLAKIEKVLDVCNRNLERDPTDVGSMFFKGGALGYRGRYYAARDEWLKAARDGKDGFDILIQCYSLAPGNHDIMLGTGIYNYFSIAFVEKYPVLKPATAFLPPGNKQIGIAQLKACARKSLFSSVEAKVVLLNIYYSFENNNTEAMAIAKELHEKYPMNPYFHKFYGRCLVKAYDLPAWERNWREILVRYMDKVPGYETSSAREALYYIGYALFNKGQFDKARKYFKKCVEASGVVDTEEESGFLIKATLRLGNSLDKLGKRSDALTQYRKVLKMKDYDNSESEAKKYIETPYN